MKGILDRFEGELAVILIEEEKKEILVARKDLPPGSKEQTIFKLSKQDDNYTIVEIDEEATKQNKATSSSLMQQLRAKRKGSKFKR